MDNEKIIESAKKFLTENGFKFNVKNKGFHFQVFTGNGEETCDFWPTGNKGSGKFMFRDKPVEIGNVIILLQKIKSSKIESSGVLFEKDILEMSVDELRSTIYMLCEKLNKAVKINQ